MNRPELIAELVRLRETAVAQGGAANVAMVASLDRALARLRAEATPPADRAQTR